MFESPFLARRTGRTRSRSDITRKTGTQGKGSGSKTPSDAPEEPVLLFGNKIMVIWQIMSFVRQAKSGHLYAPLPTPRAAGADTLQAVHDALATGSTFDQAAEVAGLSRTAFDALRQHDVDFADAVDQGLATGEGLCATWLQQIALGTPTGVPDWFREGDVAAHMGETYGWHTDDIPVVHEFLFSVTPSLEMH